MPLAPHRSVSRLVSPRPRRPGLLAFATVVLLALAGGAVAATLTAHPAAAADVMTLVVDTTKSAGTTVALPLRGNVNATINWGGAGTGCGSGVSVVSANQTSDVSCTYTTGGIYTVTISGTFTQFGKGASYTGSDKITQVTSFGSASGVTSYNGAFFGASNLTVVPATLPSTVTNLASMFNGARSLNSASLASWNTANVTNMSYMFSNATSFNQPIASWNTAKVTKMGYLFAAATSFNQPLGSWDTSSVTDMGLMFYGATAFNQSLGPWSTAKVTDTGSMFSNATSFNNGCPRGLASCPLQWNTAKVAYMNSMFSNATAFNQNLSGWCVSLIPSLPLNFDAGTTAWTLPSSRPTWGTCPTVPSAPGAPATILAASGQMRVSTTTSPASTGGAPIISYTFTSSPGGVSCTAILPATSCTVGPLTGGTSYTFTVRANNMVGPSASSSPSTSRRAVTVVDVGSASVGSITAAPSATVALPSASYPANARVLVTLAADTTTSSKPTVTTIKVGTTALTCSVSSRLQGATATAGTGVSGALIACTVPSALTGSLAVTLSAVPAKAVIRGEYVVGVPAASVWTALTPTGGTASAPSVGPSATVAAERLVVGAFAVETGVSLGLDGDTTGGSWSGGARANTGTTDGLADLTVERQVKFTTASATQTYNSPTATAASADWAAFLISIPL